MKRNLVSLAVVLLLTTVIFMACGSRDKGPAELAIKAAEGAVSDAKAEAEKIIPDQVKALETALASAKDKLTKGNYKSALTEAQALAGKAKEVIAAAKAKKDELTKKWTDLSQGLPKMVEAIQSRVDILSQASQLPAGLTAEKFAEVKSGLAAAKEAWGKALDTFKAGKVADAISMANSVKGSVVKIMETLGLPVPPGAKS